MVAASDSVLPCAMTQGAVAREKRIGMASLSLQGSEMRLMNAGGIDFSRRKLGRTDTTAPRCFALVYASAPMEKENRVRAALWYYFGLAGESRLARDWIDPVRVIML